MYFSQFETNGLKGTCAFKELKARERTFNTRGVGVERDVFQPAPPPLPRCTRLLCQQPVLGEMDVSVPVHAVQPSIALERAQP